MSYRQIECVIQTPPNGWFGITRMEAKKKFLSHVPALTSIRGFAAIWVLIFHLRYEVRYFFPELYQSTQGIWKSGFLGVDLFFVLSGFVIALNYQARFKTVQRSVFYSFMIKRFARIYPVYLMCLLCTLVVLLGFVWFEYPYKHMDRFTKWGFVQSLTMTQVLSFPLPRQWNLVAWSVSAEWFAYLFFPAIALVTSRLRSHIGRVVMLVTLCVAYVWVMVLMQRPSAMELGVFRIAGGFTMGVVLCGLKDSLPHAWSSSRLWGMLVIAIFISIPFLYTFSTNHRVASVVWAPIIFLPVIFALAQKGAEWRMMKSKSAIYLGHVSYSLYMIHTTILMAFRAIFEKENAVHPLVYIGAELCLIFIAAHLLYTKLEEPARSYILRKARSKNEAQKNKQ